MRPVQCRRARTGAALAAILGLALTACGPSQDQGGESSGSEKAEPSTASKSPQPKGRTQDICAELDASALAAVGKALDGAKVAPYDGKATGQITSFPPADRCELRYTGRKVPKRKGQVVYGGDAGKDGLRGAVTLELSAAKVSKSAYATVRRQGKKTAKQNFVGSERFADVSGVGDAAYYGLDSRVLANGRLLTIKFSQQTKTMFTALAKAMVPTLEQMSAADPEVTLPLCDPLTGGAEAALGKVTVRRDNPDTDTKGRTHCGWSNGSLSLSVGVVEGDDPTAALKQLRKAAEDGDATLKKADFGDEGYWITSPYWKAIFRKGDRHFEVTPYTLSGSSEKSIVADIERFAAGIPA